MKIRCVLRVGVSRSILKWHMRKKKKSKQLVCQIRAKYREATSQRQKCLGKHKGRAKKLSTIERWDVINRTKLDNRDHFCKSFLKAIGLHFAVHTKSVRRSLCEDWKRRLKEKFKPRLLSQPYTFANHCRSGHRFWKFHKNWQMQFWYWTGLKVKGK